VPVFFSRRKLVYEQYREFFEVGEENQSEDNAGVEGDAKIPPKEATARFYFSLTYQLAKEDITKMIDVENLPIFLCLNVAALMKERYEKEKMEMEKMKNQMKKY